MSEIVSEIVEILKSSNDLLEAELKILRLFSSSLYKALGTSLERLDQELVKDADVKVLRRDQRTIQFLFGEVTFKRRMVEETAGCHVYLLDRHLGIKPRKRYLPLLISTGFSLSFQRGYAHGGKCSKFIDPNINESAKSCRCY